MKEKLSLKYEELAQYRSADINRRTFDEFIVV